MPSDSNHLMAGKRAQGGVDWQRTLPRVTAGSRRIRNATTGAEDQSTFQISSGRTGEDRSGSFYRPPAASIFHNRNSGPDGLEETSRIPAYLCRNVEDPHFYGQFEISQKTALPPPQFTILSS
ncbi:hypothetical protein CSOJ01_08110 [Colletotrichum sojae]|uniref:Uncharacterized protein n=1 Tax=Colletotrichum sojae TaxID=2175907 RepID=A0A8H6J7H3_9PEZI|nr:hypothetical protein CSOJ01_08110 [Colletotrichum sojae]